MHNHQPETDMEGQGLIREVAGVHPSNANNLVDYFEVGDNQETGGRVVEWWLLSQGHYRIALLLRNC